MGSLGDSDDEIKRFDGDDDTQTLADVSDSETQNFDATSSPSYASGEKIKEWNADSLQFLQNTMPFADTLPLEDAFETQLVDLGGETQVLDDLDCTENISTQLLDEFDDEVLIASDDEGTDGTEVLSDDEALTDDNSGSSIGFCPLVKENVHHVSFCEQGETGSLAEPHPVIGTKGSAEHNVSTVTPMEHGNLEPEPGPIQGGFTSIRAAALRASGLAAHAMTLNGTKCGSLKQNAVGNMISPVKSQSKLGAEVAPENASGEYNGGSRNEPKGRVGRSAVRKLFTEDMFAENGGSIENIHSNDERTDLSQSHACGTKSSGLSYIDSQEPEEASQDKALDFVDRFLKVNTVELDQKIGHGKNTKTKSSTISSAKGPQSFAKASNRKNTIDQSEIFDWDDNREDEGGGEFFCQRKEEFFDRKHRGRISSSEPRRTRHTNLKGSGVDVLRNEEEQSKIHHKIMRFVHSDSRVVRNNSKENAKIFQEDNMKIKKNLINELDEQLNAESLGVEIEATGGGDMDIPDALNVGFDTQMAAEAMEALFYGPSLNNSDVHGASHCDNNSKGSPKRKRKIVACTEEGSFQKRANPLDSGAMTRQSKKMKGIGSRLTKESLGRGRPMNVKEQMNMKPVKAKSKRSKSNSEDWSKVSRKRKVKRTLERSNTDDVGSFHGLATSHALVSAKKQGMQEELHSFTPVACRTRHRMVVNQFERAEIASSGSGEEINNQRKVGPLKNRRKMSRATDASKESGDKEKLSTSGSSGSGNMESGKPSNHEQSDSRLTAITNGGKMDGLSCPKRRRTQRNSRNNISGLDGQSKPFVGQKASVLFIPRQTRSRSKTRGTSEMKRKMQSSNTSLGLSTLGHSSEGILLKQSSDMPGEGDAMLTSASVNLNRKRIPRDSADDRASKLSEGNGDADPSSPAEVREGNAGLKEWYKPSDSVCTTPVNSMTPSNAVSPVCMGNEYVKQSCNEKVKTSLLKEINNLTETGPRPSSALKDSRRRREISNVRVLYSQHLDDDIIKQQKKILTRLGVSVASSISDATHFITDTFVRTRNMLEAIAHGKPVVTHLWLESCMQARCFIDEKGYILRDAKKEKELGFSMPVSLTRASQHPLLQGRKVLITPNTKPGKEILANLVKAVDGQAVERIGRSGLKDLKFPDDLLILSCDEDYAVCVPYLEKGASVYSSELLLNGIVTQKLEYGRYRLFEDNVKRTRSTVWVRKDGNGFLPVTRSK